MSLKFSTVGQIKGILIYSCISASRNDYVVVELLVVVVIVVVAAVFVA